MALVGPCPFKWPGKRPKFLVDVPHQSAIIVLSIPLSTSDWVPHMPIKTYDMDVMI